MDDVLTQPGPDEALIAPRFTDEQIIYIEKTFLQQRIEKVYTPSSLDSAVKLLGVLGERKGVQQVIDHLRSLQRTKG